MVDKMSTKRHNLHIGKNATVHRVFFFVRFVMIIIKIISKRQEKKTKQAIILVISSGCSLVELLLSPFKKIKI